MEWMSWAVALTLVSQVGTTRIPPPGTNPAVTAPGASPQVAFPPNPGGPSLLPTTAAPTTLPQSAPTPLSQSPPGLLPANQGAIPLEPSRALPTTSPGVITSTPPSATPRAPIVSTPPSGVVLTAGEQPVGVVNTDRRQRPKADAAEMLDAWLTLPDDLPVKGRPTPLVELIAPLGDRGRQVQVAHSYWRTAAALLELRMSHDQVARLQQLQAPLQSQAQARGRAAEALDGQVRLSAARAQRVDAELALVAAQHTLAEQAGLNSDGALPLPSDRPHAGSYRTLLAQIYSSTPAPPQARLFDRQAPLRHEAIRQQAAAVQSAHDATAAMIEALHGGYTTPQSLWATLDELERAQRAFLASVRDYNQEIATYALNVPRGAVSPQELVGMLIRPLRGPVTTVDGATPLVVRPNTLIRDDAVAPATFEQPLSPTSPNVPSGNNSPTLAPPRGSVPSGAGAGSTLNFGPRSAQRLALDGSAESGLYQALVNQSPAQRAQEMAGLLHWDHALPGDVGKPLTLADALRGVKTEQRTAVIEHYWQTREWAARYHVASEKQTQLDNLQQHLTARSAEPAAADAMLRLRTAQLLAKSDVLTVRAQLAAAQMRLMESLGRATDVDWYYGVTAPHGGRYQLQFDALPESVANSEVMQRLSTSIPTLHRLLEERAGGVVLADATRVVETNQLMQGGPLDDMPLAAIEQQASESGKFLDTLSRYNREIAKYALAVLPQDTSAETLVRALVIHDGPAQ